MQSVGYYSGEKLRDKVGFSQKFPTTASTKNFWYKQKEYHKHLESWTLLGKCNNSRFESVRCDLSHRMEQSYSISRPHYSKVKRGLKNLDLISDTLNKKLAYSAAVKNVIITVLLNSTRNRVQFLLFSVYAQMWKENHQLNVNVFSRLLANYPSRIVRTWRFCFWRHFYNQITANSQ